MTRGSNWRSDGQEGAAHLAHALGDYALLVERLPVVTYVADLDGRARLRYVSPQVEQLLGYPPSDWLGDSPLFAERLHPDDRDRVLASLRAGAADDEPCPGDFRMLTRDGRTIWVAESRIATDGEAGPRVTVGVLTEGTDRRRAEEALAQNVHVGDAVLESLEEGLIVLDRSGQVLRSNLHAAELLGVD